MADSSTRPPLAVLHIPHASTDIPPDLRDTFALSDADLAAEVCRMTDWYTDELFDLAPVEACCIVFPVSRLVVDPERFLDDAQEEMAPRGMGVIYEKTALGKLLRGPVTSEARSALIERFYSPHHDEMARATGSALAAWGRCLVLDCHSFPSRPLPYEPDQRTERPDICVGTDSYHTPAPLGEEACRCFREAGYEVEMNRPFAGAFVPSAFHERNARVWALMVEVNRGLYLDESNGTRLSSFTTVKGHIQQVLRHLIEHAEPR